MKQIVTTLSLATLCTSLPLYSMDREILLEPIYKQESKKTEKTTPMLLEDLVATIDNEINKKYIKEENLFIQIFTKKHTLLTKEIMLDIFNIVAQYDKHPSPHSKLLQKLYNKNDLFNRAINHFISLAKQNFSEVTQNTLEIVENSSLQQKIMDLNKLPEKIKECVMTTAFDQIEHSYEIELSGHPSPITCFDISSATDSAAVGCENNIIYVWDLKRIMCYLMLEALEPIHQICFDSSGSKIIALLGKWHNIIKIWNSKEENPTPLIIKNKHWIQSIACAYNKQNKTKTIFHAIANRKNYHNLTTITFIIKNDCIKEITANLYAKASDIRLEYCEPENNKWPYSASNCLITPFLKRLTTLTVKKQDCSELYLCEQVIKNTPQKISLKKIQQSRSYKDLTKYETDMINNKITAQNAALSAIVQSSTNPQNTNNTLMHTLSRLTW